MPQGIVAYTAEPILNGIKIERYADGKFDWCKSNDWQTIIDFLTEYQGEALHIVWNLQHFVDVLFKTLLQELPKDTKTIIGGTKVFYVERMLGITQKRYIQGNIAGAFENNFYALQHWMPEMDEPKNAQELAERGERVLEALGLLNIYPDKLTSPAGVFAKSLPEMPSLLTGPDALVDVANYCSPIMRKEWRQVFQPGYYDKLHSMDIVSAYPFFISQLPDTDHCKIEHVTKYRSLTKNQWGIFKGEYKSKGDLIPIFNNEFLTSDQLRWVEYWDDGTFNLEDGYILTFLNDRKPYEEIINNLYSQRLAVQDNPVAAFLAKNIPQGLSGLIDHIIHKEKEDVYGVFCNPIYAAMFRTKTPLRLGHYINTWLKNGQISKHDLVNINLDEVCFRNSVKDFVQKENLRPGDWRYRVKENVVVA